MDIVASRRSPARERVLETAGILFYRDGFHAVGIDTVIARSKVAKMTLYRHFPSKDALVAAYLERANQQFWIWLEGATAHVADPGTKLLAVFRAVERLIATPQCRGCVFQAAAAEFPEPGHPGRRVVLRHKRAVARHLARLARQARLRRPTALARELSLLMEGAWSAARIFGRGSPVASLVDAARSLINAHRAPD
jgi:AcrR family transcriptional regulator